MLEYIALIVWNDKGSSDKLFVTAASDQEAIDLVRTSADGAQVLELWQGTRLAARIARQGNE